MKRRRLAKLRYNIWFYFIIFAVLIIALVWIFQIVLFDSIYQKRKNDTLINLGERLSTQMNVETQIDDATLNGWLTTAVEANEAGIFSYLAYYEGSEKLTVETIYSGFILSDKISNKTSDASSDFKTVSDSSSSNSTFGNSVTKEEIESKISEREIIQNAIYDFNKNDGKKYICERYEGGENGSCYVYVTAVKNELVDGYLVLRSSQQSLMDTVSIIQTQLLIVTASVIVVAFFISWYIATRISAPMIEMSNTAKKWASGDDSIVFSGDGYKEMADLADTLNYAKEGISQTGVLQRDLLANVSHDLKTPLTMIKAYAEMIRDLSGDIKEKRDVHTQVIIDEADRLTMLVNDILDLSKLQNGMNQLTLDKINLSELCETVLYRFKDFAERSGYKIEKEIEPDLFVECDEKKIEQVLYNLIGNSINYTGEDKTIFVKLSLNNGIITFETVDSGKGISEEKIQTIWEKYYRFSETHQRPIKGTGLGLSIVKTILEQHKLKFGVISKKDVGSNFFIQFKELQG